MIDELSAPRESRAIGLLLAALSASASCSTTRKPSVQHAREAAAIVRTNGVERVVQVYFDTLNRGDIDEFMELFAEDSSLLGAGACKGVACVGKPSIRDGFADFTVGYFPTEESVSRVRGDTAFGLWRARTVERDGPQKGKTFEIRGGFVLTAKHGLITSLVISYDLTDPGTVLFRSRKGEVIFALQDADGIQISRSRVLLSNLRQGTGVLVSLDSRLKRIVKSAQLRTGSCEAPDPLVYPLSPFSDGRSDTLVDHPMGKLAENDISVVVRGAGGAIVGCGHVFATTPQPEAGG